MAFKDLTMTLNVSGLTTGTMNISANLKSTSKAHIIVTNWRHHRNKMKIKRKFKHAADLIIKTVSLLMCDITYLEIFLAGCLLASGFYIIVSVFLGL